MDEKEELRKRLLGSRPKEKPTLMGYVLIYGIAIMAIVSFLGLLAATGIIDMDDGAGGAVIIESPEETGGIEDTENGQDESNITEEHDNKR